MAIDNPQSTYMAAAPITIAPNIGAWVCMAPFGVEDGDDETEDEEVWVTFAAWELATLETLLSAARILDLASPVAVERTEFKLASLEDACVASEERTLSAVETAPAASEVAVEKNPTASEVAVEKNPVASDASEVAMEAASEPTEDMKLDTSVGIAAPTSDVMLEKTLPTSVGTPPMSEVILSKIPRALTSAAWAEVARMAIAEIAEKRIVEM
jgi:hypothetical protein